jgi:hypothetical protein
MWSSRRFLLIIVLAWHFFPSALVFFYSDANKHTWDILDRMRFNISLSLSLPLSFSLSLSLPVSQPHILCASLSLSPSLSSVHALLSSPSDGLWLVLHTTHQSLNDFPSTPYISDYFTSFARDTRSLYFWGLPPTSLAVPYISESDIHQQMAKSSGIFTTPSRNRSGTNVFGTR